MQEFHTHVLAASNSRGFVKIPRQTPVTMKIWFFLKRPASDFVSRHRGDPVPPPSNDNQSQSFPRSPSGLILTRQSLKIQNCGNGRGESNLSVRSINKPKGVLSAILSQRWVRKARPSHAFPRAATRTARTRPK